jgi:hypothetical protein
VRDAALATSAAGTLRFDVELRSTDPADDLPRVTSHGQLSFEEPFQLRYLADEFTGIGGTSPEAEVILDDSRLYTRGRDGLVDSPETWVLLDVDAAPPGPNVFERYRQQFVAMLFLLAPALGVTHAEQAGIETVRGAATTHYVGRSSPDVALALLPPAVREPYRQSLDARRKGLEVRGAPGQLPEIGVEAWVDGDGRIARLRYVENVGSGDIEALVITYDFSAFGSPMDLELPDGAEVITLAEVLERYRSSNAPPSPPD